MHSKWGVLPPSGVAVLLASLEVPWWVAGGWALDLFLGETGRKHDDIDVGVLRRDVGHVQRALSSWEVFEAQAGRLTPLSSDRPPRPDVNSLWCRPESSAPWTLEVLLDDCEGNSWVFRRERAVRLPPSEVRRTTVARVPYLAPEIQLLYKAKDPREKDHADFRRTVPFLDEKARQWLFDSLVLIHPGHEWLSALVG